MNWIEVGRLRRPRHLFTPEMSAFSESYHQLMLDGSCIVCRCSVLTEYEIFIRVGRHSARSMDDVCVQQTFVHLPIYLLIGVAKMIGPFLPFEPTTSRTITFCGRMLIRLNRTLRPNSPTDRSEGLFRASPAPILELLCFTVLRETPPESTCPGNLVVDLDYVSFGRRAQAYSDNMTLCLFIHD